MCIRDSYEKWKDVVQVSGTTGLQAIEGFHDGAAGGRWRACRASMLGEDYRVIYQVGPGQVFVLAIDTVAAKGRRRRRK